MPIANTVGRQREINVWAVGRCHPLHGLDRCQWRQLPKDFPPYLAVQGARERKAREASSSAGVIDSQSAITTKSGSRGYNAGRKRRILTDTEGNLVGLQVNAGDDSDRTSAVAVVASIRNLYLRLRHLFADGGHAGDKLRTALAALGRWTIAIIKRSDTAQSFEVLPPLGRRTHLRVARALPASPPRFRGDHHQCRRLLGARRPHPHAHPARYKGLKGLKRRAH